MCDTHDTPAGTLYAGDIPSFEDCVTFHGHVCPGLALGYHVAAAAMEALGVRRPYDEELVAVAETDACGVDAIQMVTGCTAGKGNLIIKDYGKHAFSFFSRESGRAVRVRTCYSNAGGQDEVSLLRKKVFSHTATPAEESRYRELVKDSAMRILSLPAEQVVIVEEIEMEPPSMARIYNTVICSCCSEPVADGKTRLIDGKYVCIPCAEGSSPRKKGV